MPREIDILLFGLFVYAPATVIAAVLVRFVRLRWLGVTCGVGVLLVACLWSTWLSAAVAIEFGGRDPFELRERLEIMAHNLLLPVAAIVILLVRTRSCEPLPRKPGL